VSQTVNVIANTKRCEYRQWPSVSFHRIDRAGSAANLLAEPGRADGYPPRSTVHQRFSTNAQGTYGQYEHVEFNGARPRANNFMLDARISTMLGWAGRRSAAHSRYVSGGHCADQLIFRGIWASGWGGVNLISKAGTNAFHGTAFELYSGSGLNAVDGVTRGGFNQQGEQSPLTTSINTVYRGWPDLEKQAFRVRLAHSSRDSTATQHQSD